MIFAYFQDLKEQLTHDYTVKLIKVNLNNFLVKANHILVMNRWLMQFQLNIVLYKLHCTITTIKSTNALNLNDWSKVLQMTVVHLTKFSVFTMISN